MFLKVIEKISLWCTLFSISFCIVYFFNNNLFGAIASGVTTASIKAPFLLVHDYVWSKFRR